MLFNLHFVRTIITRINLTNFKYPTKISLCSWANQNHLLRNFVSFSACWDKWKQIARRHQLCYSSYRRNLNVPRAATTKIIQRFWSSKAIIWSVNISFIFTIFFIIYLILFNVNDSVDLTKKTLLLYDFYIMRFHHCTGSQQSASKGRVPSSETQGLLAGTIRYFQAKVYFKCWGAPGNLFLPNQFQKWSKSVTLIGQKNIFLPNQRGALTG